MRRAVAIEWRQEKDGQLYEHRSKTLTLIECPRCGAEVECEGETEIWTLRRGKWHHEDYGPATGECCDLLLVDSFNGAEAYQLVPTPPSEPWKAKEGR